MKEKLEKVFKYLLLSADNGHKGASGKKIICYIFVICVAIIDSSWVKNSHSHNDYSQLMPVLWFHGAMITTLYGINVTDKKLNNKNEVPPTV